MESRNGDKHDCARRYGKHICKDDEEQVPCCCTLGGEEHDGELRKCGGDEARNECPAPDPHWWVARGPFAHVVAQAELKGKVDEDGEGQIFLREALVEELEIGDGVVGLEADFGNEMDDD